MSKDGKFSMILNTVAVLSHSLFALMFFFQLNKEKCDPKTLENLLRICISTMFSVSLSLMKKNNAFNILIAGLHILGHS